MQKDSEFNSDLLVKENFEMKLEPSQNHIKLQIKINLERLYRDCNWVHKKMKGRRKILFYQLHF